MFSALLGECCVHNLGLAVWRGRFNHCYTELEGRRSITFVEKFVLSRLVGFVDGRKGSGVHEQVMMMRGEKLAI